MLNKIVQQKLKDVSEAKRNFPLQVLKESPLSNQAGRDFKAALRGTDVALIAEVKKASPSKGVIREDFDPLAIAKTYTEKGAKAISVLTDEKFFQGSLSYLKAIREITDLPLLRKDFTIDPYQIFEAKASGADAILLIAAILSKETLIEFIGIAEEIGLDALVEVHTAQELETVLYTPAKLIGINNRNLKTFETDINTTFELRKMIANPDLIIVSESGITNYKDVCQLKANGIDAMLVGETLMRNDNIGAGLDFLLGRRSA